MQKKGAHRTLLLPAGAILLLLLGCTGSLEKPSASGVLLITVDTLRADHLGCYGAAGNPSPRMDALADQGVLFEDAMTPVPITLPAHASLMTGVSPPIHGVRDNATFRLGPERPTMAGLLSGAGLESGAFVGAVVLDAVFGLDRGFSHYDDAIDVAGAGTSDGSFAERPAGTVVDAALGWLRERPAGNGFFLWVHLFDPHAPYDPPSPYRESHGATYPGEIAYTNHQVGRLLDGLKALGLEEGTLTILTSDHGEGLGEHGETTHGFFLYQSTVHVPLLLRLPGRFPAGRRVPEPVNLLDVLPTVLDATGIEHPVELEGKSLFNAAAGDGAPAARGHYLETYLPYYQMRWSGSRALRSGAWKFIDAPAPELYELTTDQEEQHDRQATEARRTGELRAKLVARSRWMAALGRPASASPPADEKTQAQIRSLGYLSGVEEFGGNLHARATERPDTKTKIHLVDLLQQVVPAATEGGDPEALARMTQLTEDDPGNPRLLTLLATALERQGHGAAALERLRQVAILEPDDVRSHGNLALMFLKLGQAEQAAAALENALQLGDGDPQRQRFLAGLLLDMNRPAEAAERYRRLLEANPNDAAARDGLARAEAQRNGIGGDP